MILRRLFVYEPIAEGAAHAATLAALKMLARSGQTVEFRVSERPMRILMFDAASNTNGRKLQTARLLHDPEESAADALREAIGDGDVVFNLYTGLETNRAWAYPATDAVFTVALPDGRAVAWFARISGGIAPGNVHSCMRGMLYTGQPGRERGQAVEAAASARLLFVKRRPNDIRHHEETVIAYAMDLLDKYEISAPRCEAASSP